MRKSKVIGMLLTVLAITILVKLGFWQLDRANEKERFFADYAQRSQQRISLNQLQSPTETIPRFAQVDVTGQFISRYLLLDNQMHQGQAGYHVIGLFEVNLVDTSRQYVMVNLGWVPWGPSRAQRPQLELPQDPITLTGYFYLPEITNVWGAGKHIIEDDQHPIRVQQLQADEISAAVQLPIQPYVVLLSESADFGWSREWQPQVMTPAKHRAYAFQWFSLALACLLVFWFASRSKKTITEE